MSIFGSLTSNGLEEAKDVLGGFSLFDTDVYRAKIKEAYAGESKAGAQFVAFIFDIGGKEYRETFYVTNRNKLNYYERDGKKNPLPGFTMVENICLITTGKELHEQDDAEKVVKVYDSEQRKEVKKPVPMLIDLVGKEIALGIFKQKENKTAKNDEGNYVATPEEREVNVLDVVFHPDQKFTVAEARAGAKEPKFQDAWLERNKGTVRDRRKIKGGSGTIAGLSSGASAQAQAAHKSLFG